MWCQIEIEIETKIENEEETVGTDEAISLLSILLSGFGSD